MKIKIILLTVIALILMLPGCGSRSEEMASKDYIYRVIELPVSGEFRDGANITVVGDNAFLYGTVWDEFYMDSELLVARISTDGDILEKVSFKTPPNSFYGSVAATSDGRLFATRTEYPVYDDGFGDGGMDIMPLDSFLNGEGGNNGDENGGESGNENGAENGEENGAENGEEIVAESNFRRDIATADIAIADIGRPGGYMTQTEQHLLVELGMDGSEKQTIVLSDNLDLNTMEYFYVNQIFGLPGNKLIVSAMEKFAIYESDGTYLGLLELDLGDNVWGVNFVNLRDGRTLLYYYGDQTIIFKEFDPLSGRLGNEYTFEGNVYNYSINAGAGYDLYLSDQNNLYGYDLGQEPVKLMNYVDSDLSIYSISTLFAVEPGRFLAMIYDTSENRNYFAQLEKVPPEDVIDRIGLVLAGSYIDWEIRNRVISFNKSNEKYRISLMDYGSLYNTGDDWNAGVTRLNTDIASGRIPDIVTVTNDLPFESYMAKGLFADFLSFIDKDDELDVSDLMPNVVSAYSMNGKMYRFSPQFSIGTVFAKTSLVGSEPGWTIRDAQALSARMPDSSLFDMMVRSTLMYYAMIFGGDQFIDWEKGICKFDDEAFIHLLEFMKEFPEEIDYSMYDEMGIWNNWESRLRTDSTLLMLTNINNIRDYNSIAKGQFGEEITAIGFPGDNGIGAAIFNYQSFAISAKSKNQDGAWAFLRQYLTEDFQTSQSFMFPISRKAFDIKAKEAMEKPYYMDQDGNKVEYDDIYYLEGQEIILTPMTQAEVDKFTAYILTVDKIGEYNEALVNIINEEAGSFFAGQKNVHEVVEIIQSRAQIYVNENR
ncbi:MAG: extracellular solute-binding protein [Lachnospiraceae bacterium]|nr:extracellular solute-binding protein [Lachnospiraceae bacterium]